VRQVAVRRADAASLTATRMSPAGFCANDGKQSDRNKGLWEVTHLKGRDTSTRVEVRRISML
jgi:hypothetical protein